MAGGRRWPSGRRARKAIRRSARRGLIRRRRPSEASMPTGLQGKENADALLLYVRQRSGVYPRERGAVRPRWHRGFMSSLHGRRAAMSSGTTIAVVGGGASGVLVAAHLATAAANRRPNT